MRKPEQGRFGRQGARALRAPVPSALLPLKSDTHCLESKAQGRSLALSECQGTAVMLCPGVLSAGGKEVVMPWSLWILFSEWGGSWRSVLLPPLWSGRKFSLCLVLAFVIPISICFHQSSRSLLVVFV